MSDTPAPAAARCEPDPKDKCGGGYRCWLCKRPWGWETFRWLCEDCFMALGKL